jgi:type 1 fimbriae regulatory protein FimB
MPNKAANRQSVKSRKQEAPIDADSKATNYITEDEFTQMLRGARAGRHPQRDVAILRLIFEHGLRVTELATARISQVKLNEARFLVKRLKRSLSTEHPLSGSALRALRPYLRARRDSLPWLFLTERGAPFSRQGLHYLVGAIAARAGLHHVHPHMLRHGCGFALANKGKDTRLIQDYLGHKDIRNTVKYTRTAARRFEGLWD